MSPEFGDQEMLVLQKGTQLFGLYIDYTNQYLITNSIFLNNIMISLKFMLFCADTEFGYIKLCNSISNEHVQKFIHQALRDPVAQR